MEGYSLADVMALTGKSEGAGFSFGGVGGLILILLFFIVFGGAFGGGFGRTAHEDQALSNLERDVLNGNSNTQKAILESNYNNLLSFKDAQYQMSQCCCNLEKTIMAEGATTRALIENNTIQELRDRLNTANNALTVQTIVNGVTNQLRSGYFPYCPNGTVF